MHDRSLRLAAPASLAMASIAGADVRLPAIFADHMVIQQNTRAPVWGWAAPGEEVRVRASWGSEAAAVADDKGKWSTVLDTPAASGVAHSIRISAANLVELADVLVGEVWVCSGQSNMEWQLQQADGGAAEARTASHPHLRLFNVPNVPALAPVEDVRGAWTVCTPETAPSFTAVGYFFARRLQSTLDVPIGLIETDWGGTPAESWTSAAGLEPLGDFGEALTRIRRTNDDPAGVARDHERAMSDWIKALDSADPGFAGPSAWNDPALDDGAWPSVRVPSAWAGDAASFDGLGWYRTSFDLPDSWIGADGVLELGPIDDCDMTWVNGTLVGRVMYEGEGNWQTPRRYQVPATVLRPGRNSLAIRVLDAAGPGGLYGKPEQLVLHSARGDRVLLAGAWKFRTTIAFGALPPRPWTPASLNSAWTPTTLFNGMIAPIAGYGIRGAIWYQGESNVGRAFQYRRLFPAMITDWRAHWKQGDFPFYFVQIAPFGYGGDRGQAAELREAQALTLRLPNTGMAVTMDIGNPGDIHPGNKRDVGDRLARWALHKDYGRAAVAFSGPVYKSMTTGPGAIRLAFEHAEGLVASDGRDLSHFTIAGSDRRFVPARAVIEGETIVVSAAEVPEPVAVRFGWGAADMPNLKNGAGLPASSFRTDDWPMITAPRR